MRNSQPKLHQLLVAEWVECGRSVARLVECIWCLDTYTAIGNYKVTTATIASNIDNMPVALAGAAARLICALGGGEGEQGSGGHKGDRRRQRGQLAERTENTHVAVSFRGLRVFFCCLYYRGNLWMNLDVIWKRF